MSMLFFVYVLLCAAAVAVILLIVAATPRPSQHALGADRAQKKWGKSMRLMDGKVTHAPSPDRQALPPMVVAAGMQ